MPVALSMRHEKHDAVARPAVVLVERPRAIPIESNQRVDPSVAVEIRPLIGKSQVDLDDASTDCFQIGHAAIAGKMLATPIAGPGLDGWLRDGPNFPIVECAVT